MFFSKVENKIGERDSLVFVIPKSNNTCADRLVNVSRNINRVWKLSRNPESNGKTSISRWIMSLIGKVIVRLYPIYCKVVPHLQIIFHIVISDTKAFCWEMKCAFLFMLKSGDLADSIFCVIWFSHHAEQYFRGNYGKRNSVPSSNINSL